MRAIAALSAAFALLALVSARTPPAPIPKASPSGTAPGDTLVPFPRRLPPREHLPALARSILSQRMENHSYQMTELTWSVIFLEHDATRAAAENIAHEPSIARPGAQPDATDLSSQLPKRFFDLQDDLDRRARDLAAAAGEGDDTAIAKAWGRLSETCVACHAAYLEDER